MTVHLATKTMKAIEDAVHADQGAAYRSWLGKVIPHMGDAFRGEDEGFRSHLGASMIGRECPREIWYGFRWATKTRHSGRMIRLFNRGHLEEARFIALLLTIGCQVFQQDENGKQFRISDAGGHFGGSGDGVVIGLPDLPQGVAALSEFKTHNDKSFQKLKAEGVALAKPEHYVQMQTYIRKMGLGAALYAAVNKNDDEIYMEIVVPDTALADQFIERGVKLVKMHEAPARINESPGWYKCKFCDHNKVCHQKQAPNRNCRTCEHSAPNTQDGKWYCHINPALPVEIAKDKQLAGCENYSLHRSFR